MQQLLANPVFQIYAAAAVVLGMNLLLLANGTAVSRARHKEVVNPEDKKLNAQGNVVYYEGNSVTQRYRRAHANALENIPLFLITGFLLTLTPIGKTAALVLFAIFVAFRLLHSIAYVKELQPWRTMGFAIAALDQVAILGFLGYWVLLAR